VLGNKDGDKGQAMRKGGGAGGGRGRYKAQRVKRVVSIITCNLTASATHHIPDPNKFRHFAIFATIKLESSNLLS
jgi:hypothetical protein